MDFYQISALLAHPSWDLIVIFGFIAAGFFYGISAGRARLIAVLVSLYISGFIFENFYYIGDLVKGKNIFEEFLFRGFIFIAMVTALSILFFRVLEEDECSHKKYWWKFLLLSFTTTGLLFSYIFHLFPAREIFTFSPAVQSLFASNSAFFWWLVLPLTALFLARK